MKLLLRIIAGIVFVVFFGFALKNTQEVALHFFLNYELRGPLVFLLFGFCVGGFALGVLAMTPTVFRYRRELNRQQKNLVALQQEYDRQRLLPVQPSRPDGVLSA